MDIEKVVMEHGSNHEEMREQAERACAAVLSEFLPEHADKHLDFLSFVVDFTQTPLRIVHECGWSMRALNELSTYKGPE